MQQDFDASLADITKAEDAAITEFEGLVAAKEKEIQAATEAIETKTARAGETAVQIVSLKNDLKDTKESLGDHDLRRKALRILSKVHPMGDRAVDLNFITLALRGKKQGFDKVVKMIEEMVKQLA